MWSAFINRGTSFLSLENAALFSLPPLNPNKQISYTGMSRGGRRPISLNGMPPSVARAIAFLMEVKLSSQKRVRSLMSRVQ